LQLQPPSASAATAPADPFSASTVSSVQHAGSAKNSLSAMGLQLDVFTVRLMLVIVGSVCLAGLLVIGLPMLRSISNDEPSSILARYGPRLIPVRGVATPAGGAAVEVASMEKLAQIAELYDRIILREEHDGVHSYLVQDGEVTYRYQPQGGAAPPTIQRFAPPPTPEELGPLRPEELPKLRILHREAPEGSRDTQRGQAA
jgi:hypothetical protein